MLTKSEFLALPVEDQQFHIYRQTALRSGEIVPRTSQVRQATAAGIDLDDQTQFPAGEPSKTYIVQNVGNSPVQILVGSRLEGPGGSEDAGVVAILPPGLSKVFANISVQRQNDGNPPTHSDDGRRLFARTFGEDTVSLNVDVVDA